MPTLTLVPIRALDASGNEFWWTGKAGAAWVSRDRADAFVGFTLEGARRKAALFNGRSAITGLHFVAVAADAGAP